MATTRRDIELLISARETTGRSFKQVTDNISALNTKIAEQIQQAERGEISLQELRKTQEQLAQAGRDLSAIQGQVDAYNRLVATQDKVGAAAEKAKADLAALKAEIESAGVATAAQERKLQRLENAVVRTGAAVDKNNADLLAQVEVLQRAGIATDQLEAAQTGIVNTARNIGTGLSQVNTAIDGYAINLARARDAEQQLAAQQGFERKIQEAQRLGDASRFVQLFGDAIDTVKSKDNQLEALTGFRNVGAMAAEASRDMSRFVQAGEAMATSSSRVAAGLREIINPGGQALQTLDGVEQQIRQSDQAAAEGVKNVGLLNNAYNDLAASAAALVRQGALIDTFQQQEAAAGLARQQFEQAQAEVQRLGRAMQQADAPTEELARSLQIAEAKLEQTGRALAQEEARLGVLSRELKQAGINTDQLAQAQQRLETAANQAANATARINTTLGRGGQKTNGLFGLKPNEITNLGYQVNDIFVGLASGQKPLTVLIQQGAQIGQIFPGLISTIARFALAWAPAIIAVGAVTGVIGTYIAKAEQLKAFQDALNNVIGGENYDAAKLSEISDELQHLGVSADDAKTAILAFVEEGLPTDKIELYTEAARNLADRLGVDLAEATEYLTNIQHGGIEAVFELTEKTHDLTDADLDHVEALYDAGKAAEARQYVLDRVAERNAQIAHNTRSIWTPAVDNLRTAFSNLFSYLADKASPILDRISQKVKDVAVGLNFITGLLAGKGFDQAAREAVQSVRQTSVTPGANAQSLRDRQYKRQLEEEFKDIKSLTREERLRRVEIEARRKAQEAGVSKSVEDLAVAKARTAEEKKISEEAEKAGKKADSARAKADRAAKAEENRRKSAQQQLTNQLRQLDRAAFTGSSASLTERLGAIDEKYAAIYDSVKKLKDLGLSAGADGTSLAEIEKRVEATKERLKAEETIKFYQEQASLLDKQRSAELQKITDAQERGALSVKDAMEQAAEVNNRLSPQIVEAARKALAIAQSIAGTNPSPEMVSWIASLERIINGEATNRNVADVGLAGLDQQSAKLNELLKERDDLVKSYQTLGEIGLKSDAEVRELTAQAYQRQAQAIQPVLVGLRETIELLHNTKDELTGLPVLSDTAYATWQARLDAINAGLQNTDARIAQVNQAAMQGIQNGVANAFQTAADTIVGLINGTNSWGDALDNVLNAGLSLLGSFLEAIAQVLVQMVALQAAKALIGGSTGGFGGLFFHGGGVVGSGGSYKKRTGGSGSWIGAPKFHGGGGLGLRPDEYKAVLKRGEEVLTEDDPRHRNNLGSGDSGGSSGTSLQQNLFLDPSELASAMQNTKAGQKSIMTVIRTNIPTIKQMLS